MKAPNTKKPTGDGARELKVRVKKSKKLSNSSVRWLERQLNDPFVAKAKRDGYRSRAVYKLEEIADKQKLFKPGGAFLCKVLQGGTEHSLLAMLKRDFTTVKHVKPAASRADSAELYLLATGFRGQRPAK
jgi:23S rRNA U2552 (ribose-2'-O)-methylase RlmE/FtsJ